MYKRWCCCRWGHIVSLTSVQQVSVWVAPPHRPADQQSATGHRSEPSARYIATPTRRSVPACETDISAQLVYCALACGRCEPARWRLHPGTRVEWAGRRDEEPAERRRPALLDLLADQPRTTPRPWLHSVEHRHCCRVSWRTTTDRPPSCCQTTAGCRTRCCTPSSDTSTTTMTTESIQCQQTAAELQWARLADDAAPPVRRQSRERTPPARPSLPSGKEYASACR